MALEAAVVGNGGTRANGFLSMYCEVATLSKYPQKN
jgi:hypothetical protein